jgi:hypothetical protein
MGVSPIRLSTFVLLLVEDRCDGSHMKAKFKVKSSIVFVVTTYLLTGHNREPCVKSNHES